MNILVSTRAKSLLLAVKACTVNMSEDMKHSCVDIRFNDEMGSRFAFSQLKEMGLKCCHAGMNAPEGAAVMVYANNSEVKLKIWN